MIEEQRRLEREQQERVQNTLPFVIYLGKEKTRERGTRNTNRRKYKSYYSKSTNSTRTNLASVKLTS